MTKKNLNQAWDQASCQILATAINGLNEAKAQERNLNLNQFTTPELEQELLNRQKCSFGRLTCTNQAQDYMTKPQNPTCFNCKQDILSLENSHGN